MPLTLVFKRLQGVSSKQSSPHASCSLIEGEIPSTHTNLLTKDLLFLIRSASECPDTPIPVFLRLWSRTFLSGFILPIYSKSQSPASWSHPRLLGTELSKNQEREFRELRGTTTGNAR